MIHYYLRIELTTVQYDLLNSLFVLSRRSARDRYHDMASCFYVNGCYHARFITAISQGTAYQLTISRLANRFQSESLIVGSHGSPVLFGYVG